ncbi:hypothetical protein [Nocardia sp. NRRL WC-3656]|uniref:hypothetical protein n=1 Tax=Nocardia sp. NRRL WC-3656 TaxID=1463824 RepID=UPI0012DC36DD|nr:hypothetical protein [Nocardia sp. NRRL WC-3656]
MITNAAVKAAENARNDPDTAASILQWVLDELDRISTVYYVRQHLLSLIDIALRIPIPPGNPRTISERATTYEQAVGNTNRALADLECARSSTLPASWHGEAAETASQALKCLSTQGDAIATGLRTGHDALNTWASKLGEAQKRYTQGREQLSRAQHSTETLPPSAQGSALEASTLDRVLAEAKSGCMDTLSAVRGISEATTETISTLRKSATTARMRSIAGAGVDPLIAVTLAYAHDSPDDPDKLTTAALTRAARYRSRMSSTDRAAFDKLVADARSPEEAANLWKMLGGVPDHNDQSRKVTDPQHLDAPPLAHETPWSNVSGLRLQKANPFHVETPPPVTRLQKANPLPTGTLPPLTPEQGGNE